MPKKAKQKKSKSPKTAEVIVDSEDEFDNSIRTTVDASVGAATFDKKEAEYCATLTMNSSHPFTFTTMTLSTGIFSGSKVILLKPQTMLDEPTMSFLDLPTEIRMLVYAELFVPELPHIVVSNHRGKPRGQFGGGYHRRWSRHTSVFSRVAIFTANRQIHDETTHCFYGTKLFHASTPAYLVKFLERLGSHTALLRRVGISIYRESWSSRCLSLLSSATNLQSLDLGVSWISYASFVASRPYLMGDFGTRAAAHIFKKMLVTIQQSRNDREAVADIVKFDKVNRYDVQNCKCASLGLACDGLEQHYAHHREEYRQFVLEYLPANTTNDADDDADESEPTLTVAGGKAAPRRRDTGRPKRKSVTDKNINYAEE